MATCTEFKNNDFPTDMNLDVSCSEANVSAGPVSLSNGASMNLSNTGSFNLQDLSTTDGGNITINAGGDLALNNVTCGADLTLVISGMLTLNGALNVKGSISIQSGGELQINQSITQQEGGTPGPIDISATGKITVSGPITGEKDVLIESTGDMLQIDSTVEGKGEISLQAPSSEVNVTQNITQQDGDDLGTLRISASGKVTIEGTITGKKNMIIESTGDEVEINDMIIYDGDTGDEDLIEIKTANNDITVTEQINAGGAFLRFTANQGKIDVSADILAPNNHAVFVADKEIALANVDVSGNAEVGQDLAGSIQIMPFANGGAATQFTIGGSGHTNGVNGKLFARTATGGLSDPERWSGGVLVFNKGNGGIKLDKTTDIVVRATSSKNGVIVLDADEGSIDIPEGTLSVNGQSGNSAGLITLIGQDINFPDSGKTILSASDTVSSGGLQHTIALSAENINYSSAQGLDLRANGAGDMTWVSAVALFPKGGLKAIIEVDGSGFKYTVEPQNNFDGTDAPLNVTGAGPLTITSNGSNSQVRVTGNPVTFDIQGDVSIVSNGQSNTNVTFSYTGPSSPGAQGLILSGPGSYEFLSNGMSGGNGGSVLFSMPSIEFNPAGGVVCRASGEGSGMGGNVIVNASNGNVSKDEQITLELIANGGGSGGQGGLVAINATLDINLKDVTCRANGAGSGNGGAVTINGTQLVVLDKANIVSQAGTDGNGGSININSRTIRINDNTEEGGDTTLIRCMGGSNTGDGGILNIISQDAQSVGNEVNIFASPQGSGKGGSVTVRSVNTSGVDIYGENVNIQAKGLGTSGDGGVVTIEGGDIVLNAQVVALAQDEGKGGTVTINADASLTMEDKLVSVVGGTVSGDGGDINLTMDSLSTSNGLNLQARAMENGVGGNIIFTVTGTEMAMLPANTAFNLTGGATDGKGGNLIIDHEGELMIETDAVFNANSIASNGGDGGTVTINGQARILVKGQIVAGGQGTGLGGNITINNPCIDIEDGQIRANGDFGQVNLMGTGSLPFNFTKTSQDTAKGVVAANGSDTNPMKGGTVTISNPNAAINIGTGFAVRANGSNGDSDGGIVNLTTQDTIKADGIIAANSVGAGLGGSVNLSANTINSMNGEIRAIGDNGQVNITGSGTGAISFSSDTTDPEKGVISANSSTSGAVKAGTVSINNPNGQISVGANYAIRANGSAGDAEGGIISIISEDMIDIKGDLTASGMGSGKGGDLSLNGDQLVLSQGKLRARAGNAGNGGTVTLVANKLDDTETTDLEIIANASENGEGGMVSITINGTQGSVFGANSKVTVTGGSTDGKAGQIVIDSQGKVKIDTDATFDACGIGISGGDGGNIIATTQDELSIFGKILADSAMEGSAGGQITLNVGSLKFTDGVLKANGDEGRIEIIGSAPGDFIFAKISSDPEKGVIIAQNSAADDGSTEPPRSLIRFEPNGDIVVDEEVEVRANGTAIDSSGGVVVLAGNRVTIKSLISADGQGFGQGGVIEVTGSQGVSLETGAAKLSADGGEQGNGGRITISSVEDPVDLPFILPITSTRFSAIGNGVGEGGRITIDNATNSTSAATPIYVHALFKVNGGDSSANDAFFGSISLNGINAEQRKTNFSNQWPKTYWQTDNAADGFKVATGANVLQPQLKNYLAQTLSTDNPVVQIYSMSIVDDFEKFLDRQLTADEKQLTFGLSHPASRISAAFERINDGATQVPVSGASDSLTIQQVSIVHELGHQLDYIWGLVSLGNVFANVVSSDFEFIDFDSEGAPKPCLFSVPTCNQFSGSLNSQILTAKYAPNNIELFGRVFGHVVGSPNNFFESSELENVLLMLLDSATAIQDTIDSPPPAQL